MASFLLKKYGFGADVIPRLLVLLQLRMAKLCLTQVLIWSIWRGSRGNLWKVLLWKGMGMISHTHYIGLRDFPKGYVGTSKYPKDWSWFNQCSTTYTNDYIVSDILISEPAVGWLAVDLPCHGALNDVWVLLRVSNGTGNDRKMLSTPLWVGQHFLLFVLRLVEWKHEQCSKPSLLVHSMKSWLLQRYLHSIQNWMGPNPNGPPKGPLRSSYYCRYSGFFRGPFRNGPLGISWIHSRSCFIYIPKGSMGLVYLPTFTIKINQM